MNTWNMCLFMCCSCLRYCSFIVFLIFSCSGGHQEIPQKGKVQGRICVLAFEFGVSYHNGTSPFSIGWLGFSIVKWGRVNFKFESNLPSLLLILVDELFHDFFKSTQRRNRHLQEVMSLPWLSIGKTHQKPRFVVGIIPKFCSFGVLKIPLKGESQGGPKR